MDLDPGLAALRPLGGFFLLRAPGPPPRPLPTLADAYAKPEAAHVDPLQSRVREEAVHDPLTTRVRKVADAIRAPEPRVAASVAHQGLAARLWSVTLGCAALYGTVPDLDPRLLHWDPRAAAPDDLWLTEVRPGPDLAGAVLEGHLRPLAAALRARHRLAPGLLRGNAASALAGAARQLERWAQDHDRPGAAARARTLTAALLAHPDLAGAGLTLPSGGFRRRSCCLYYRVPGGGVCGDCCFPSPPRSSPRGPSG